SFSTQTATVFTFYVSQTDVNGCESPRQPVSVSVVATPSAPAVSSVSLCQGATGQFSTTIPGALWYTAATGGIGSNQPPTLNNQTSGDQIVYVSQTLNGCESPRTAVKATIYPIPAAPAVLTSLSLCQNSPASSLTATGSGLIWYGQSGQLTGAPTPNTSIAGTQSFSVSQTVSGCESPRTPLTVRILTLPASPTADPAQFCVGTTPGSLSATGSSLKWYTGSVGGVGSAGSPSFSTQTATVFTFYVSQTDVNGCESPRQPVSVSVVATPSAPAVSSVSLCQGATGQFSTTIPGALWYTAATGGIGSNQPPTLNNQTSGDQIVYVSQTLNGCESPRTAVKATIYPIPAAPTAATTFLCQFSSSGSLSATGLSLTWYNQSGRLAGAPVPNTSLAGTQSYSVSQTVNTCESPRTAVSVVIRPAPSTPTAGSISYCINDVPRSLTAAGSNIKWYTTSTDGTSSPSSPAFFTEAAKVYTFYVTQTDTSGCESVRQPVSVSVVAPPSAPTVTAIQLLCQSSQASPLTASPNTGLIWQGPGVTAIDKAPTPITSQPGAFTYLVSQKAGSCTSPAAQIVVTVSATPDAPSVTSSVAFCIGDVPTPLSATGSNLTWYTNAERMGPSLTQVVPNTNQANITTYYVTQKNANNCESPTNRVEVRVSKRATASLSGDGYIYPGDSTAIRIRLTGDARWTLQADWLSKPIVIDDPKDSLHVEWVHPTKTTTYAITSLSTACGLGESVAPYTVRVISPLSAQPIAEPMWVNAYPNPTTGEVSVNWSSPTKQTVTLQIVNATGTIIKQVTRQSTSTPQTEVFHIDTQPAGMYFIQLKSISNGVMTKPIIKH
ncbi:T9SS type A sorting domain-containing protein, partial [Spirosoma sp. RP8]